MNQLTRLDEFTAALENYQLSSNAASLLDHMQLVLLIGPSSSGRNTIINKLVESGHYHSIVSDTTRQPRINNGVLEENGREYWFRAESDMLHDIQAGEFLEAAVIHAQQVSGISIRELKAAADKQLIAINEIEVTGANNIHAVKPDTLFIFVLPPSFDEWMERMSARGVLPEAEVRRRLQSAVSEIAVALERDYYRFVVNDTFAQTAALIDTISKSPDTHAADMQAHGREVAEQLLVDTKRYLAA